MLPPTGSLELLLLSSSRLTPWALEVTRCSWDGPDIYSVPLLYLTATASQCCGAAPKGRPALIVQNLTKLVH